MFILGIAASPRRQGNSECLLDAALEGADANNNRIEKLIISDLRIEPCRACDSCFSGKCIIRDDMDYILPRLEQADVIIVASPIYFYGLTGQLKLLIDRSQVIWNRTRRLEQTDIQTPFSGQGALIAVGATKGKKLFKGAILTIKCFFKVLHKEYKHEILVTGVNELGAIDKHPQKIKAAYQLGWNLAQAPKNS